MSSQILALRADVATVIRAASSAIAVPVAGVTALPETVIVLERWGLSLDPATVPATEAPRVTIVAKSRDITQADRDSAEDLHTVSIAIQQKVAVDADATDVIGIDPDPDRMAELVLLAEAITNLFRPRMSLPSSEAEWRGTSQGVIAPTDHLQINLFTAVIEVQFSTSRSF